jgi:hypothetical protein
VSVAEGRATANGFIGRSLNMPLSPNRVWEAIQEAKGRSAGGDPGSSGGSFDEHGSGSAGSGPTAPSEGGGL